ncbi:MAG: hypothetical protein DMG09_07700 [Acidobacteria bacterium]|nr:MAG: hypothetical protein DMG09_07700 [Acidobacteriota bacterium]
MLVVSALLAGTAVAVKTMPLPNLELQALDGSTVNSSDWPLQGKWVLIYVEGRCGVCTGLLVRLNKGDYPQLAAWTIVIAGGMQPKDVHLARASWYADAPKNASAALDLRGAPVILGIQDKVVRWGSSGIPADPKRLQSMLTTWTAQ